MELVNFGTDLLHCVAERAASYRIGQSVLRQIDRGLWVFEKCARWAVPPPLDQEEKPQPELVRPLPWILFLPMLIILRLTRESLSLINLALGKPPLRSTDVVMYIQGKRRYIRTLKYQGNRAMRARNASQSTRPWYSAIYSMFELTMCFRNSNYGNNNTTQVSNNDEVLVVKRSKRGREDSTPEVTAGEATMERLIEKMMVELDAESDDDSSYTLTNATSFKSDQSIDSASDHEMEYPNGSSTPTETTDTTFKINNSQNKGHDDETDKKDIKSDITEQEIKENSINIEADFDKEKEIEIEVTTKSVLEPTDDVENVDKVDENNVENINNSAGDVNSFQNISSDSFDSQETIMESYKKSPAAISENFIQNEKCSKVLTNNERNMGTKSKSWSFMAKMLNNNTKRSGELSKKRGSGTPLIKIGSADKSF